jgi:hypothetical protein
MRRLTNHDDRGFTTIIVVLAVPFIMFFGALVFDGGRGILARRQTQSAADAGALAKANDCVKSIATTSFTAYETNGAELANTPVCGSGTTTVSMKKTITISFVQGGGSKVVTRSATAKWGQLNSGIIFPFTFSACAFPDTFTAGTSTSAGTYMMLYGQGVRTTCDRDSATAGQDANSKGFVAGGCQLTSIGLTLTDAQGNNFIGTNCDGSNLDYYVGKDVLVPVWGAASGTPSDYTITSLVGFHVLGWSGNGSERGGAMSSRCTASSPVAGFKGDAATRGDGNKPCLYGYVTAFTSTSGGTTGGECLADSLKSACVVYLDS